MTPLIFIFHVKKAEEIVDLLGVLVALQSVDSFSVVILSHLYNIAKAYFHLSNDQPLPKHHAQFPRSVMCQMCR